MVNTQRYKNTFKLPIRYRIHRHICSTDCTTVVPCLIMDCLQGTNLYHKKTIPRAWFPSFYRFKEAGYRSQHPAKNVNSISIIGLRLPKCQVQFPTQLCLCTRRGKNSKSWLCPLDHGLFSCPLPHMPRAMVWTKEWLLNS